LYSTESCRNEILTNNTRNFAVLTERPLEQPPQLQKQIDEYKTEKEEEKGSAFGFETGGKCGYQSPAPNQRGFKTFGRNFFEVKRTFSRNRKKRSSPLLALNVDSDRFERGA